MIARWLDAVKRGWATLGRRYDRRRDGTSGPRSMWETLDDGEDPTLDR